MAFHSADMVQFQSIQQWGSDRQGKTTCDLTVDKQDLKHLIVAMAYPAVPCIWWFNPVCTDKVPLLHNALPDPSVLQHAQLSTDCPPPATHKMQILSLFPSRELKEARIWTKGRNGQVWDAVDEDDTNDAPHLTLHLLSATAPLRHKVDITRDSHIALRTHQPHAVHAMCSHERSFSSHECTRVECYYGPHCFLWVTNCGTTAAVVGLLMPPMFPMFTDQHSAHPKSEQSQIVSL